MNKTDRHGDLQQYDEKAHSSIMVALQQLADKKVFTPIEAGNLLPEQLKRDIKSSISLKKNFTPEGEFPNLKPRLVTGCDQQDRALYVVFVV